MIDYIRILFETCAVDCVLADILFSIAGTYIMVGLIAYLISNWIVSKLPTKR